MAQPDWEESWQEYDQPLEAWPGPPGYAPEHHEYTPPEYRVQAPTYQEAPYQEAPYQEAPYQEAPYQEAVYPEAAYPEPANPEPAFPRAPYQPPPDPEPYSPYPRYSWERDEAEYRPDQSAADRRIRRWLLVAPGALVAGVVAAALVVGHGGGRPARITPVSHSQAAADAGTPSQPPPAISRSEAQQVLARYAQQNNVANRLRDNALLGTIEAGTSYQMDTGSYRMQRAERSSSNQYVAFGPEGAVYFIPRQASAAYPRWFVVHVTYADLSSPGRPTGTGYLVFSQASPGTPWKDVFEPNTVPGSQPRIARDAQGYAIEAGQAAGLSVAPGQIAAVTAASLDDASGAIKNPGNLADVHDEAFFLSESGHRLAGADRHMAAAGPVFGLRTADSGAILFYSLAAQVSLTAPRGDSMHLEIPGFYSSAQTLASAKVGYVEQFATYDPPQRAGGPRVVADVSGIVSRG